MHQEGIGFCVILSVFYRNVGLNTLHISCLTEIWNSEVGADLKQFPPDVLLPERQFDSFINFVGNLLSQSIKNHSHTHSVLSLILFSIYLWI